jgi:uncharacterized protein YqfA (UPF0365 family)
MRVLLADVDLSTGIYFLIFLLFIVGGMIVLMLSRFISLWFQALVSGTPVALLNIVGMSLRKIPPRAIVSAFINAHKAGIKTLLISDLETHFLAGGNISNVVRAMIAAEKANIPLTLRQATAIDLAGRDILDAVRTSVNPKVIDCPDAKHGNYITAVAQDGIQVKCHARVTVRTNIQQLVGGATEETIIARVGESIVNAIGASKTHTDVLESPNRISNLALEKGLDAGTAFQILSIDIADISIGDNIGAKLRADQAESDKRIAQAKAEERRAMGLAMEQENAAKVTAAEAEVPLAIAEAFRKGNLGLMDFYRLKNIQADTAMRQSISDEDKNDEQN